jgi:hypothetical protein
MSHLTSCVSLVLAFDIIEEKTIVLVESIQLRYLSEHCTKVEWSWKDLRPIRTYPFDVALWKA